MKNFIAYYYNLFIKEFKKKSGCFNFDLDGKKYYFIPCLEETKTLYNNYIILKTNNRYCHEIIKNKDNDIVTLYNNIPYVLIKENIQINKLVDINEIKSYDVFCSNGNKLSWKTLWENKIDYYEYQMSQIFFKYPLLKKSFNYYVGLTETAISLLNYVDILNVDFYINHKRIYYKETLEKFFNPIEILRDSRTRDVAEFIKINYINNSIEIEETYRLIEEFNFNQDESILFMSRLIYPSYYFDLYDQIIQDKVTEEKLHFYFKKNTAYEVFLSKIYMFLKRKHVMPNIEWLDTSQY